jgi:hypothetical protein
MKRLNQGQKITIIWVAVLLLVSFLFPPWVCRLGSHPIFESAGYKFILAPPGGFDVSIDLWRLLIQSVVIVLAGFIAFCVFAWRTPRDTSKPSTECVSTKKNVDNLDDQPTTPSRFKSQEEYEAWKSERLELLSKKQRTDLHVTPSPKISTHWLTFYTYIYLPIAIATSFVPTLAQYDKKIEQDYAQQQKPIFKNQQEELDWLNEIARLKGAGFSDQEISDYLRRTFPGSYQMNQSENQKKTKFKASLFIPIIIGDILICFLIYGLHKRYLWAWTANWILLGAVVLLAPLSSAKETGVYLVAVILIGILFFIPNYIYFRKRRVLFG